MAVTFVRSGLMTPGKYKEAMQWVQTRNKWLNETFGVDPQLQVLLGGPVGRIAIASQHESVAQIEEIRRKLAGGNEPDEISLARGDFFVPGKSRDRIWLQMD